MVEKIKCRIVDNITVCVWLLWIFSLLDLIFTRVGIGVGVYQGELNPLVGESITEKFFLMAYVIVISALSFVVLKMRSFIISYYMVYTFSLVFIVKLLIVIFHVLAFVVWL